VKVLLGVLVILSIQIDEHDLLAKLVALGVEEDDALHDLNELVEASFTLEDLGAGQEDIDALANEVVFGVALGELDAKPNVFGIDTHHVLEDFPLCLAIAALLVDRLGLIKGAHGVFEATEAMIGFTESLMEAHFFIVKAQSLLVDGDGLLVHVSPRIVISDGLIGGEGLGIAIELDVEVAAFEETAHILRIVVDEEAILFESLIPLTLAYIFLCRSEHFTAINCHVIHLLGLRQSDNSHQNRGAVTLFLSQTNR
jgi:hypothetical protein